MKHVWAMMALACAGCGFDLPPAEPDRSLGDVAGVLEPAEPSEQTSPIRFADAEEEAEAKARAAQASINPMENDLRNLEVAFRLLEAFEIKTGGARFELELTDSDQNALVNDVFILEPTSGVTSAILGAETGEGMYVRTYRLAEADKPRMAAAEAVLAQRKIEAPGMSILNLGGAAVSCLRPGAAKPETYSLTMYFRTSPDIDFVPMTSEMLMDQTSSGPMAGFWESCERGD